MFIVDETTGDITLVQGDTGQYVVSGLPTDQYYTLCFAIQDSNRNPIGQELSVQTDLKSSATINIPSSLTDLLTVKKNDESTEYLFGLKLCSKSGKEDTLLIGNKQIGEPNIITVYPKKVEGTSGTSE